MTAFVRETTKLQRKYNKSDLSPSTQFRQMVLSPEGVEKIRGKESSLLDSLRAQVHKVAWIDERVYLRLGINSVLNDYCGRGSAARKEEHDIEVYSYS